MFGSAFKMRPKPGKTQELLDTMTSDDRRPTGMIAAYLLSEASDGAVWGFAVFEDEQSYRANAESPQQHAEYERFRALLEADPEWHDGEIVAAP